MLLLGGAHFLLPGTGGIRGSRSRASGGNQEEEQEDANLKRRAFFHHVDLSVE